MNNAYVKLPPSGGIRYSRTWEIQQRLLGVSHSTVKSSDNGPFNHVNNHYDNLKQQLSQVENIINKIPELQNDRVFFSLKEAQMILINILEELSKNTTGIYRDMIKQFGFLPVIIWYIEVYMIRTKTRVNFRNSGPIHELPNEISETVFFLVNEALGNTSYNNREGEITVEIMVRRNILEICIMNCNINCGNSGHVNISGLAHMLHEEIAAHDGKLHIVSTGNTIKSIKAELPLLSVMNTSIL